LFFLVQNPSSGSLARVRSPEFKLHYWKKKMERKKENPSVGSSLWLWDKK
jgi:hypothetical protein